MQTMVGIRPDIRSSDCDRILYRRSGIRIIKETFLFLLKLILSSISNRTKPSTITYYHKWIRRKAIYNKNIIYYFIPINPKIFKIYRIENYKKKLHFSFHPLFYLKVCCPSIFYMDTKNTYNVKRKVHSFMLEANNI